MKVAIVFGPLDELGPDPLDEHKSPRALGQFIDSDTTDTMVVWREYGEQFEGGHRDHIATSGIWEHIGFEQVSAALEQLEGLRT